MADIQKEEKVNVFQIVSDVYQDNVFMPKKQQLFWTFLGTTLTCFIILVSLLFFFLFHCFQSRIHCYFVHVICCFLSDIFLKLMLAVQY